MLRIQDVRDNKKAILDRLAKRGEDFTELVDLAIRKDEERRTIQAELDSTLAESNRISKEIGKAFGQGNKELAESLKAQTGELKTKSKDLEAKLKETQDALQDLLYQIPNAPGVKVPSGKSEEDNEVILVNGVKPQLENALPHWEIAEKYDLIDFELGVKITGAGFPVYKGKGARLQRALINWFLDEARDAGYEEVLPPIFVNEASGYGTGQLPDKEGQMYHITGDNLYVIPTAEVPITNIFRDTILHESDFPNQEVWIYPMFPKRSRQLWKGRSRIEQIASI
jgi:seryl-tRNA synthetase